MSQETVIEQHPDFSEANAFTVDAVNPDLNQHFAPEDVAAFAFKTYAAPFEAAVKALSGNEAKRVLTKLVLEPVYYKTVKLVGEKEQEAYYVANDHLIPAKYMMFFHTIGQAVDQAKEGDKLDGTKEE